jgi:hypothetical protein
MLKKGVRADKRNEAIVLAEMLSILSGWMLCGMYKSLISVSLKSFRLKNSLAPFSRTRSHSLSP